MLIDSLMMGLNLFDRPVQIGLSNQLCRQQRHGVVRVKMENGGEQTISFLADKPQRLARPNLTTINSIFEQVEKLEMIPTFVEVTVAGRVRVYERVGETAKLRHSATLH